MLNPEKSESQAPSSLNLNQEVAFFLNGLAQSPEVENSRQLLIQQLTAHFEAQISQIYKDTAATLQVGHIFDQQQPCQYFSEVLGIDILFYTPPNKPAFMMLPVRDAHSNASEPVMCQVAGIIVPIGDETPVEAAERARLTERKLRWLVNRTLAQANGAMPFNPKIIVADQANLACWRDYHLPEQTTHPDNSTSTTEVCQVLTQSLDALLGKGTYSIQVHALDTHEFDLTIVNQQGEIIPLNFLGLGSQGTRKRGPVFEPVDHVVGLRVVPDMWSDEKRIELIRRDMKGMRRRLSTRTIAQRAKVLSVTRSLVRRWQDLFLTGEQFCEVSEVVENEVNFESAAEEVAADELYGKSSAHVAEVRYVTYEKGPSSIGAKPSFLEVQLADGRVLTLTLDAGAIYEGFSWHGPFKPPFKEGIAPFEKLLPQVPLWLRLSLLLKKAEQQGITFLDLTGIHPANLSHSHFQLLDIFNRLRTVDFKRFCKALAQESDVTIDDEEVDELIAMLTELSSKSVFQHKREHIGFLISHFHDDHVGFAATVSSENMQLMSVESQPWISYFSSRNQWQYQVTERVDRTTLLKESSGERFRVPHAGLMPYETTFIHSHVSVTSLPCDHSIYGSTMFLVTIYDELKLPMYSVLYTGDYRFGDQKLSEKTMEVLSKIKVDSIITDTTNIGADESIKPKKKTTPEKMVENFADVIGRARGPVIIQLDPKDLETTFLINLAVTEANKKGGNRRLIYNLKLAAAANLFMQIDQASGFFMADPEAQQLTARLLMAAADQEVLEQPVNLLRYHPRPRLNSQVRILDRGKQSYSPIERAVLEEYSGQVLKTAEFLGKKNSHEAVLIIPPYMSLEQELAAIVDRLPAATVVRAHFFPYSAADKSQVRSDYNFCAQHGWKYETDLQITPHSIVTASQPRFRMGGHAQPDELIRFLETLYAKNNDLLVIPVHGENRGKAADQIQNKIKESLGIDANVVVRMTKDGFVKRLM